MKKSFIFIITLMCVVTAMAQTRDTICSRYDSCYYTRWYDTCRTFLDGQIATIRELNVCMNCNNEVNALPHYTSSPIQVKGGLAMVMKPEYFQQVLYSEHYSLGFPRLPEYVILYQYDEGTDNMIALDSARWDTLTPKIMKVPLSINMDTFAYCYAYEAYFDKPVTVDSTFYIAVTSNSNEYYGQTTWHYHIPTFYFCAAIVPCNDCPSYRHKFMFQRYSDWTDYFEWFERGSGIDGDRYLGSFFGGVLPIVDMNDLETRVAGQGTGTVAGGGRYARGTYHDIAAIPNPGYRFQRWNDGVTDSSRTVYLTQDTLFTAYFLENDMSEVRATSTNDTLGTVEGGGLYHQGVTVTLTARPADSCYFVMWTDSVLDNPRSFVLTHDTSFAAVFARQEFVGIDEAGNPVPLFTLTPNPAKGSVTVSVTDPEAVGGKCTLTLSDAAGRRLLTQPVEAATFSLPLDGYPAGTYFLTLATPSRSSTQKLVVE
jgi:hypothetical protein